VIHTNKIYELTQGVSVSSNETRVNSSITSDAPQLLFLAPDSEDSTVTENVEKTKKNPKPKSKIPERLLSASA
jgi:hypothetical protein